MTIVPGYPPPTRCIQVFVDSVALLAGAPVAQCVFLCDDGEASQGQGSATLATRVVAGQFVCWRLNPIDLQAPAWIADIDLGRPGGTVGVADNHIAPPWARRWEGYVPLHVMAGQVFPYRLLLTFADGSGDPVAIDGMSLTIGDPLLPDDPQPAGAPAPVKSESIAPNTGPDPVERRAQAPTPAPDGAPSWVAGGSLRDTGDVL